MHPYGAFMDITALATAATASLVTLVLALLLGMRRSTTPPPYPDLQATHEALNTLRVELANRLTALGEGQRSVTGVAEEVARLTRMLVNPRQRGVVGEFVLETALQNVLGAGNYQLQHTFPDGTRVDAVVRYGEMLIPIDSKFSLDNYSRMVEATTDADRDRFAKAVFQDLKTRVDETAKYVRPDAGTMEFALMFLPSEALYYDMVIGKAGSTGGASLVEYAHQKKVVPVSPVVLFAYLQTVNQGQRMLEFSRSAEEMRKRVAVLKRHLQGFEDAFRKARNALDNANSAFSKAEQEWQRIDRAIDQVGPSDDSE
jgi:DNA recombination protein RmuC